MTLAELNAAQHGAMVQAIIDAVTKHHDEMLPSLATPGPNGRRPEGRTVSALLCDCDDWQQAQLFRLLFLALNKDNAAAIHEAAMLYVRRVAEQYAELYVESRGDA